MSTKMIRSLISFYATPDRPTQDEQLAAAARVLADRKAAEDKIDIKEHIRRYHGGHLEPGESCPFLEKIKAAEEEFCTLDPKDADGDGNADFPEEEVEEAEGEVSEDAAIRSYFKAFAKDDFKEVEHPRESKGLKGGGRFRTSEKTIEKEDEISNGPTDEEKEEFKSLYNGLWQSSDSLSSKTFRLWEIAEKAKLARDTAWMGRGPNSVLDIWMQKLDMAKPWVKKSREEQEESEEKAFKGTISALEGSPCDVDGDFYRAGVYYVHGRGASKDELKTAYKKMCENFKENGVFVEPVFYENDDYPRGVRVRKLTLEK